MSDWSEQRAGLDTVSEILSSTQHSTSSRRYHHFSDYDAYGIFTVRLHSSIVNEIRNTDFIKVVSANMEAKGSAVMNNRLLEEMTAEEINNSQRLAIATSNSDTAFTSVYHLAEHQNIITSIRSYLRETVVGYHLLEGIRAPPASSSADDDNYKKYSANERRRIQLLESTLYSMPKSNEVQLLHRDMLHNWNQKMVLCFVGLQDNTKVSFVPGSHNEDYNADNTIGARTIEYNCGDILFFKPSLLHSGYRYPADGNLRLHYYILLKSDMKIWEGEKAYLATLPEIHAIECYHLRSGLSDMKEKMASLQGQKKVKKRKAVAQTESARDARGRLRLKDKAMKEKILNEVSSNVVDDNSKSSSS
jgi:hypothetical protein